MSLSEQIFQCGDTQQESEQIKKDGNFGDDNFRKKERNAIEDALLKREGSGRTPPAPLQRWLPEYITGILGIQLLS